MKFIHACVVDQDVSHHLRTDGEEVCAVLPVETLLTGELEIRLVDECRCLKRMTRALLVHLALSDASQLRVYEREELVERRPVAF